eukprot:gene29080-32595_t
MEHLDPDNIMRVIYQKTMNNANGYFNPTFALWQGKVISAWGDPKTGVIQLAWYDPQGALTAANISSGSTGVAVHGPSVVYLVDSRLLALSDGSLHVTYTSVQLPQIVNIQYLTIRPVTDSSGSISANFSVPRQLGEGQKNWVSFE